MNSEAVYCPQPFPERKVATSQQNGVAPGIGAIFYSQELMRVHDAQFLGMLATELRRNFGRGVIASLRYLTLTLLLRGRLWVVDPRLLRLVPLHLTHHCLVDSHLPPR